MSVTIISQVLQECYESLVDGFYSATLVARLYSQKCINTEEMERVESGATNIDKSRQLLKILRTKANSVLDTLLAFFQSDGTQTHFEKLIYKSAKKFGYYEKRGNATESDGSGPSHKKRSRVQILPQKWWPEHKELIKTFVRRNAADGAILVEHLRTQLLSSDCNTAAIVAKKHALVGMGGIGKTSTVKWYANAYQAEYEYIIWIDSEGQSLSSSFTQLAKNLGLPEQPGTKLKELAGHIYEKLQIASCLFVFDNAESYDGDNGLKSLLPRHELHHSIITSRNQDWGNPTEFGRISTFQLDVFSDVECTTLMSNALALVGRSAEKSEMLALGAELGFLPLALQCAMATIAKSKWYTLATYLDRIRVDLQILVDKQILNEYERSISATLQISIEQIEKDDRMTIGCRKLCTTILNVAAFCDPNEISEYLFLGLPNATKFNLSDAMDQLVIYSLLTVDGSGVSDILEGRAFQIHRLLQHVIRCRVSSDANSVTKTLQLTFQCVRTNLAVFQAHATHAWRVACKQFDETLQTHNDIPYEISVASSFSFRDLNFIKDAINIMTAKMLKETELPVLQLRMRLIELLLKKSARTEAVREYDALNALLNSSDANVGETLFLPQLRLQLRILSLDIQEMGMQNHREQTILEEYYSILQDMSTLNYNGTIGEKQFYHASGLRQTLPLNLVLVCRYSILLFEAGQSRKAVLAFTKELQNRRGQFNVTCIVQLKRILLDGVKPCPALFHRIIPSLYRRLSRNISRPIPSDHAEAIGRITSYYTSNLSLGKQPIHSQMEVLKFLASMVGYTFEEDIHSLQPYKAMVTHVTNTCTSKIHLKQLGSILRPVLERIISLHNTTDLRKCVFSKSYWLWLLQLNAAYAYIEFVSGSLLAPRNVDRILQLDKNILALLESHFDKFNLCSLHEQWPADDNLMLNYERTARVCQNLVVVSDLLQVVQSKLKLVSRLTSSCSVKCKNLDGGGLSLISAYDEACYLHLYLNHVDHASELWCTSLEIISGFASLNDTLRIGRQTLVLLEKRKQTGRYTLYVAELAKCVDTVIKREMSNGFSAWNTTWLVELIARLFLTDHYQAAADLASLADYPYPHRSTPAGRKFTNMKALLPELSMWSNRPHQTGTRELKDTKKELCAKLAQLVN